MLIYQRLLSKVDTVLTNLFYSTGWEEKGTTQGTSTISITDHSKDSSKKQHKRTVRRFCKICQKINHNTEECYKNPVNKGSAKVALEIGVGDNNEVIGEEGMAQSLRLPWEYRIHALRMGEIIEK